jgi:hypothetical protein
VQFIKRNVKFSEQAHMIKNLRWFPILFLLALPLPLTGQTEDQRKFELGVQVVRLPIEDARGIPSLGLGVHTEPGFGARFGYNVNRYLALEAEGNFFPRDYDKFITDFTGGRAFQTLFGAKAGLRQKRFGVFGKVRPGFFTSTATSHADFPDGNGPNPNNRFGLRRVTASLLTLDVGGVVEFYPTKRTILRFVAGDTITRYPDLEFVCFPSGTPCPVTIYSHKFQMSIGWGWRF